MKNISEIVTEIIQSHFEPFINLIIDINLTFYINICFHLTMKVNRRNLRRLQFSNELRIYFLKESNKVRNINKLKTT